MDDICVFVIDLAAISSCPFETNDDNLDVDHDEDVRKNRAKRRAQDFRRYTFPPEKSTQNSSRMPKSKSTKINYFIGSAPHKNSGHIMRRESRVAALRRVSELSFNDF